MKKLIILSICLLLTSCFEITEKIKHNSDQSGDYSLVVDFSSSWFKTKSAIMLEEVDGVSIPNEEDIKSKLAQFRAEASKIKGISKISTSYDFNTYIFKINFSYNSLETLNAVLNAIDKKNTLVHFKNNNGKFERIASYPLPKNLIKNEDKKEDLLKANIVAVYTFDKDVAMVQNANSKLSKSKKTVFLKQNIWNVLNNNKLMNNSISFNP
ncbi:MAG: hypothetical protein KA980_14270 [Flavobacterium sp.]|uniref:Lipoprotein n=2 Tax=Flavobacterium cheniae TaxID=295428 RepID=A0A562KHF8_9FLAO|nr:MULTISPECIES: hypothetical protein [unclassified Flavobacterium]MBP7319347.1 hypothetical protein [Flavobacterium sp.]TDR24470.1 hypothetical protein C8D80_1511 [Flavobacterium cheniae]TWH94725.1 hypothetical protein IP97_01437 [Flavobacterium cheniae]